jgi:ubiquinone/menaquinone biosynthesis C-methylase UbiE
MSELDLIKKRYEQRNKDLLAQNYLASSPYVYMSKQEKEREFYSLFKVLGYDSLSEIDLLEICCGRGDKILDLLQMGFSADRITGNELIEENIHIAKKRFPEGVKLFDRDARALTIKSESQDIVYQSMVFSSILDGDFQQISGDNVAMG